MRHTKKELAKSELHFEISKELTELELAFLHFQRVGRVRFSILTKWRSWQSQSWPNSTVKELLELDSHTVLKLSSIITREVVKNFETN